MKRSTLLLCLGLVVLLVGTSGVVRSQEEEEEGDGGWSRPVTPVNPIQVDKPKNWTLTGAAECPKECTTNGCCTASWDQLGWLLLSMPKSNCSFCRLLRYTMGGLTYDNKTDNCAECLVNDFTKMVSGFRCNNDNGKCSKCCMDLTLIYLSRFVMNCPMPVWRRVADYSYSAGLPYDGSSSCPVPKKKKPGEIDPYDYEYFESLDPSDPRRKIDWPQRVGEKPGGQGELAGEYENYHYLDVHNVGLDMYG